ncbi:hypothetical protein ACFOLJ_08255 [Rugamonas sp. CCM 8940]|uniref:hypothetical protein n=1 Tax=Rugamonas sp. CCM 8940 TaxID=2765359 RepID=UPI0018F37C22|nr:hypothetical protein [Rugamonas sp. CCM 8940]MBJ7309933.1 hypothetical protein [Rugamonas sp. CCM 8940]
MSAPTINMQTVMRPAHVNWVCSTGIVLKYEGTELELIAAGLLYQEELPGQKRGCNRTFEGLYIVRLKDGRARVQMSPAIALERSRGFKQFLGGLLADSRLSLVQGEARI